jgi:hypothetical protein
VDVSEGEEEEYEDRDGDEEGFQYQVIEVNGGLILLLNESVGVGNTNMNNSMGETGGNGGGLEGEE